MNILITGATGFIGKNLVIRFSSLKKYKIFATYNKKKPFKINNVNWIKSDLLVEKDILKLFRTAKFDVIIHAAATTSGASDIINKPYHHVTDNVIMSSLLLRYSYEFNIKKFLFFSCTVMYQSSDRTLKETDFNEADEIYSKYFGVGWTKVYIEKMLQFFSRLKPMKCIAIRHSNIYGPYDKFNKKQSHVFAATISKVANADDIIEMWGDGSEKRDLLHIDDLIDFVKIILRKNNYQNFEIFNCGLGKSVSIKLLTEKIIKFSGKNIMIKWNDKMPSIKTNVTLNCKKAKSILSWSPKITLTDGIQKTYKWYIKNENKKKII